MAKYTADVSTPPPLLRQTSMDNFKAKKMDSTTKNKFAESIAKCMATACIPVNIVHS